jgi:hypothetical protein
LIKRFRFQQALSTNRAVQKHASVVATMAPSAKSLPIHQKILNVTATLSTKRGIKHVCRKQVAAKCGLTTQTKGFTNSLSMLKNQKKFLTFDKDTITINEDGISHADVGPDIGSNQDLLEEAKNQVKGNKAKKILVYLFDGQIKTRADVAKHIGSDPTSKGYTNILGSIKKWNYIEYVKLDGEPALRMTDGLFACDGRPDGPSPSSEDNETQSDED